MRINWTTIIVVLIAVYFMSSAIKSAQQGITDIGNELGTGGSFNAGSQPAWCGILPFHILLPQ